MPQIRVCPRCSKVLQTNERHSCSYPNPEYSICEKCGEKYLTSKQHICLLRI